MSALQQRLAALGPDRLRGMRRGIEKESLRSQPDGKLALTPHPAPLGSALTHPHITTDYSESQLELITGVHASVQGCLNELTEIHQFVLRTLKAQGDERLWVSSMPCGLPTDETIPLGRYGSSNVGRAKSVYRMGLGHRYGRRMQTISGIHYNWSLPGVDNDGYFSLIRNFRRHAFLLLTLFGASPAVCSSFVEGRNHELQKLGASGTLYMPHGTSLRMGRLGYQSEAQATLAVSYNGLEGYAASLHDALTRPWPAYETVGIRNPGGDYNQLATTLLQIENEFYGTIRPKRVIFPGERPLHALRERGVEYIEVRLMDLNPFEPIGIDAMTLRFLDVFLLHCLLADSPPDTPSEIRELAQNQHLTAARGAAASRSSSPTGGWSSSSNCSPSPTHWTSWKAPTRTRWPWRTHAARCASPTCCPRRACSRPWPRTTTIPSLASCAGSRPPRMSTCWPCPGAPPNRRATSRWPPARWTISAPLRPPIRCHSRSTARNTSHPTAWAARARQRPQRARSRSELLRRRAVRGG
jgi:glutamate--cysteine ligase